MYCWSVLGVPNLFLIRKKIRNGAGNITGEYLGEYQRGLLKGNMNSLLYHCFPSLLMAPHFPFTDRKRHQPLRQLIDRGYWIYSPQKDKGNWATWNISWLISKRQVDYFMFSNIFRKLLEYVVMKVKLRAPANLSGYRLKSYTFHVTVLSK